MEKIKLISFDVGGTLLYPHPGLGEVYSRVAAEYGATVPSARFESLTGPVFRRHMDALGTQFKPDSDAADRKLWLGITRELEGGGK